MILGLTTKAFSSSWNPKPTSCSFYINDFWQKQVDFADMYRIYMGLSENGGTPKSSILIGASIINHPVWGTTILGNPHMKWFCTSRDFGNPNQLQSCGTSEVVPPALVSSSAQCEYTRQHVFRHPETPAGFGKNPPPAYREIENPWQIWDWSIGNRCEQAYYYDKYKIHPWKVKKSGPSPSFGNHSSCPNFEAVGWCWLCFAAPFIQMGLAHDH